MQVYLVKVSCLVWQKQDVGPRRGETEEEGEARVSDAQKTR